MAPPAKTAELQRVARTARLREIKFVIKTWSMVCWYRARISVDNGIIKSARFKPASAGFVQGFIC
jgi:hypothetical protein